MAISVFKNIKIANIRLISWKFERKCVLLYSISVFQKRTIHDKRYNIPIYIILFHCLHLFGLIDGAKGA